MKQGHPLKWEQARFVKSAMHTIPKHRLRQRRVTAVVEDRALSFMLRKGATLEELSDRVADLGRRHNGWPLAITVRFASARRWPR